MTPETDKIYEIYRDLIPHFNYTDAKVYVVILACKECSAMEIIEELNLCKEVVYRSLRKLVFLDLISETNEKPRTYSVENASLALEKLINYKIKKVKEKREEFRTLFTSNLNSNPLKMNTKFVLSNQTNF